MPLAGEFWLADIPFTNGVASKLRPVLLLWEDAADVVVAVVTSANPAPLPMLHQGNGLQQVCEFPPPSDSPALIVWSKVCFGENSG